jgi:uridine phosphorylase
MVTPHLSNCEEFKERKKIILHHSWKFISEQIKPYLKEAKELVNEDYPILIGKYKNKKIACVCTRMGIEESVNIVDQLISIGADTFVKIGSFVALKDSINIGDIYIPKEAARLPGVIDAVLPKRQRIFADKDAVRAIQQAAKENNFSVYMNRKVLTCPLYGFYIRDESKDKKYTIDYWKDQCFGEEMECSGVFAVAKARKAKSAAILICNRRWEILDNFRKRADVEWYEHKNLKSDLYKKACHDSVVLALESIIRL